MSKGIYKRKPFTEERLANMSKAQKGKKPWNTGLKLSEEHRKKISLGGLRLGFRSRGKGRKLTEEHKARIALSNSLWKHPSGKDHPNWKNGESLNPYPSKFNNMLKKKIRQRDGFVCVVCKRAEQEEKSEFNRVLSVNHIDFNKDNCDENNLNTLCLRCNIKINYNRDYWTNYFMQNAKV